MRGVESEGARCSECNFRCANVVEGARMCGKARLKFCVAESWCAEVEVVAPALKMEVRSQA